MKKITILIIISVFTFNGVGQCYSYDRPIIAQADTLRPVSFSITDIDPHQTDEKVGTRLSPDIEHLHFFWAGYADGDPNERELLSDKGSGLMRLALENMPVPPGFVIDSEITPDEIKALSDDKTLLRNAVSEIEKRMQALSGKERYFGDIEKPLFLSARAGYPFVAPGNLPTLLNIGLNDQTVSALEQYFDDKAELYNMYFLFVWFFTEKVLGYNLSAVDHMIFHDDFISQCRTDGIDLSLKSLYEKEGKTVEAYKKMINRLKEYLKEEGLAFPEDSWQQLSMTIEVFHESVDDMSSLALTVQAMVFGNLNDDSCTGIAASRQPITGKDSIYIEMAHKSQGPAVVTPSYDQKIHYKEVFKRMFPAQLESLKKSAKRLEVIYKDIRNIEFTIEDNKLYLLQQRQAFVHPVALVHCAIEMGLNGTLTYREVANKIDKTTIATKYSSQADYREAKKPLSAVDKLTFFISYLRAPIIDPAYDKNPVLKGFPLCPGVVTGSLIVRNNPRKFLFNEYDDPIAAMESSFLHRSIDMYWPIGFITENDSLVNHIAELARRKMAEGETLKPSVTLRDRGSLADDDSGLFYVDAAGKRRKVKNGKILTIDGNTGNIYLGKVPTVAPIISEDPTLRRYLEIAEALLAFFRGDNGTDIDSLQADKQDVSVKSSSSGSRDKAIQKIVGAVKELIEEGELPITRNVAFKLGHDTAGPLTKLANYHSIDLSLLGLTLSSKDKFVHRIKDAVKELIEEGELPTIQNVAYKLGHKEAKELTRSAKYHKVDFSLLGVLLRRDVFIHELKGAIEKLSKENIPIKNINVARKLGYPNTTPLTRRANRNKINLSFAISS
ncbi:MAG: PEP/pyruvate-binding domain-containing protein [Candidatus Orphnella occulta]|nr:PEP/pyruvate-binding domain-containing protein [Candidatus Orphnella occulta]